MLHASTQKLIQKLCELTESGDIAWQEGQGGRCFFDTEGYRVEVAEEPAGVWLLDAGGRELERAEGADLALAWPDAQGTYASHIATMARSAHRIARGAERAISKILSSLSAPSRSAPPALAHEHDHEPMPAAIEFETHAARAAVEPAPSPNSAPTPPSHDTAAALARIASLTAPTASPTLRAPVRGGFGGTTSFAIAPWRPVSAPPAPSGAASPKAVQTPPQAAQPAAPPPVAQKAPSGSQAAGNLVVSGTGPAMHALKTEPPRQLELAGAPRAPRTGADIYKPWSSGS